MTPNQVISITDGVRKAKPKRVVVQAAKVATGIELRMDFVADSTAIPPNANAGLDSICFKGCSNIEHGDRSYWIASDNRVGVFAEEEKLIDAVVSFSTLQELTAATSTWPMMQLVSVWNQLPGARKVARFENRSIAIERLWRAFEGLPNPNTIVQPESGKENKQARPSKSERLIALLRTPGGVTLQALMTASGWQAHSVRGFLSGKLSKQLGLPVESFRRDGERVYALPSAAITQAVAMTTDPSKRDR